MTKAIDTGAPLGSILSKKARRMDLESKSILIFKEHLDEKKYAGEAKRILVRVQTGNET